MEPATQQITDTIALAARFVNSTSNHIFLTGKAGTGKTTFLQNLAKATHKKFAIVAPTGIAALNAGGVTIHSQFIFPFGSFLPADIPGEPPSPAFYDAKDLARRHPLNSARKQVLRDIELLIIDEVSMLRADLLDAIDYRMKAARGNFNRSFGGVQLLMIGDLYQLPPIVKDHEWSRLRRFYKSPHFFESLGLKQNGFTYIELDKIFRQQDDRFIGILNNLRNNTCTPEDIDILNSYFREKVDDTEGVITLTTHNRQADAINNTELQALKSEIHSYRADIKGDFPESLLPLPEILNFKVGAQIMFVKNDPGENRFYNGKLGKIVKLNKENITVALADEDRELTIEKVDWENKKYNLNASTKELEEEIAGTFTQFPIKLAWAITVHKSQGLTFDKAIIDVGQAFAPGQVYVALSRLRSLDGLTLRTRINTSAISCDGEVVKFSGVKDKQEPLHSSLKFAQQHYLKESLRQTFDFEDIIKQIDFVDQKTGGSSDFTDPEMQEAIPSLRAKLRSETENTFRFQDQIASLIAGKDEKTLQERIEKGSAYYTSFLNDCIYDLLIHMAEVGLLTRTKTYLNLLGEIDQMMSRRIADMQKASHLATCILNDLDIENLKEFERKRVAQREVLLGRVRTHITANPKNLKSKSGKKRTKKEKSGNKVTGETYLTTYKMISEGLDAKAVAEKREMAVSTIEGHIARGIQEGEVQLKDMMEASIVDEIRSILQAENQESLKDVFALFKGKYSYGQLRMVQADMQREMVVKD